MRRNRVLQMSERWFRLVERLYPPDFCDELGHAVVETYMDRARAALAHRGTIHVLALWLRALADSLRNGAAERLWPAASWRRTGNWGRDIEFVTRRLVRSRIFAATTIGTLTIGHGRAPPGTPVYGHRRVAAGFHLRAKRRGRAAAACGRVHFDLGTSRRDESAARRVRGAHSRASRRSARRGSRRGRRRRSRHQCARLQQPRSEAVPGWTEGGRHLADSTRARRACCRGRGPPAHADGQPRVGAARPRGAARA